MIIEHTQMMPASNSSSLVVSRPSTAYSRNLIAASGHTLICSTGDLHLLPSLLYTLRFSKCWLLILALSIAQCGFHAGKAISADSALVLDILLPVAVPAMARFFGIGCGMRFSLDPKVHPSCAYLLL